MDDSGYPQRPSQIHTNSSELSTIPKYQLNDGPVRNPLPIPSPSQQPLPQSTLSPDTRLPYSPESSSINHFAGYYEQSEPDHGQYEVHPTFPPPLPLDASLNSLRQPSTPPRRSSDSNSTHDSRLPLQYNVTLAPDNNNKHYPPGDKAWDSDRTRAGGERTGRSKDRSGYKSPQSRPSSGDRLGQWSGPGGRNSPYGPLGDGGNDGQRSGMLSANSSNPNLLFAEGDFVDLGSNAFTRFILSVYDSSFLVRWLIYIIPVLVLIWIPGIVGVTAAKNANIWGVKLFFWSVWLTVVWTGWWGCALVARFMGPVLKNSIGILAPDLKHYIGYINSTQFYIGLFGWATINWVSFLPLINNNQNVDATSAATIALLTQGLFGIFIVVAILLGEKMLIQIIAHNFHKKSYEARILEQKANINILAALYLHSRDLGRSDTLDGGMYPSRPGHKRQVSDPTLLVKKAVKGVRKTAQTFTSIIGVIASEMAGEKVLLPNSPIQMVHNALMSTKRTKHLARRIYYSFTPSYRSSMTLDDIRRVFGSLSQAEKAFALFDRDTNGDANLEEVEMACLDIKSERSALSSSMTDIDSAVGRLDSIIMSLYYVVAVVIIIGLLDASFNTMIASAGTLLLGMSWLLATTAQEILASVIFLFVKHLYDVGDRVDIDGVSYIVLEMHLLSTIFRRTDGMVVQAPHVILNQKFVNNIRRSGAISETFTWDVDFTTSFEKIEALRERMIEFLELERRDFLPEIDITVKDFAGQSKLSLAADIRFRSNWQNGALKALRRNKWICALKICMESLQIYGPDGAGDPDPPLADPTRVLMLPYSEEKEKEKFEEDQKNAKMGEATKETMMKSGGITLRSRTAVLDEVEHESDGR